MLVSKYVPSTTFSFFDLKMHHSYLPCFKLLSKYNKQTLLHFLYPPTMWDLSFLVFFGFQNINRRLILNSKPMNMLSGTFFVVCLLLTTLVMLFLLVPSATLILLQFNLEKYHFHFALTFLTTVDLSYCLFWCF